MSPVKQKKRVFIPKKKQKKRKKDRNKSIVANLASHVNAFNKSKSKLHLSEDIFKKSGYRNQNERYT